MDIKHGDRTINVKMPEENYLTVEITKTVPVADRESLEAYLNIELKEHIGDNLRDGGLSKKTAGTKALQLIEKAGFKLISPKVSR